MSQICRKPFEFYQILRWNSYNLKLHSIVSNDVENELIFKYQRRLHVYIIKDIGEK